MEKQLFVQYIKRLELQRLSETRKLSLQASTNQIDASIDCTKVEAIKTETKISFEYQNELIFFKFSSAKSLNCSSLKSEKFQTKAAHQDLMKLKASYFVS